MRLPAVCGIVDGEVLARKSLPMSIAAEALLEGGLRWLQFRWKGSYTREVYAEASRISEHCRAVGALLMINDRADIALLLDAGVHTGQDDLPPLEVRRIAGRDRIVGVSTHNEAQFVEALGAPVTYIAIGPMYATLSKERPDPVVGTTELARLCRMLPAGVEGSLPHGRGSVDSSRAGFDGPVVAIGGITRERAPDVWKAGAGSVAIIGDLYPDHCTKAAVRARAEEWIRIMRASSEPSSGK